MTIETIAPVPFQLENWSVDGAWEGESLEQVITRMSMDGKLNAGFVWRAPTTTLTFQPGSASIPVFQSLQLGQSSGTTVYRLGGTLFLPGVQKRFTFEQGVMTTASFMPNGGETLAEQAFTFQWERVYPVAI
nr:hypothetical protein [Asaia astilbis]